MPGRTHKVTIRGEEFVQACERRWNNFCRRCEAEREASAETYQEVAVAVAGMGVSQEVFYDLLLAMIEVFVARGEGFDATRFVGEAERARFGSSSLL